MPRNNKNKWYFHSNPRKALTAEEAAYIKNSLSKISKVGLEFEFNLPEKKTGSCKGDSNTCPCLNLTPDNSCWQECINSASCLEARKSRDNCHNVTATCEREDCISCEHFATACAGVLCPNFVSACYTCENYTTDCEDCKYRFDPAKNPDSIRQALTAEFRPNNSYGQVTSSGVHSITTDGSLLGKKGAEVITVGRRIDYWEFFKMTKNIIDSAKRRGAYMNERCSIHMHALASYYGKVVPGTEKYSIPVKVNELERDLPEIVLANLHQLVRRYQNAMTWMMMGLNEPERLTRWEKFRVSVLPVSAAMNHMRDVKQRVSHNAGGSKYGWINYNQIEFGGSGDVRRFHVEFRACDGLMSPSAIAAIACMYYALIIKAVEISRYGVMEIGDEEWLNQAQEVKAAMLNNMKGYQDGDRFADTSNLGKYYDILVEESLDLVRQLKAILIKVGPAFEVLEKLAEKPCALRRVEGKSWESIEKDLEVIMSEEGRFEVALSEIITLNQVSDCSGIEEWIGEVGSLLRADPELEIAGNSADVESNVMLFVEKNQADGRMIWSEKIGAPIMI